MNRENENLVRRTLWAGGNLLANMASATERLRSWSVNMAQALVPTMKLIMKKALDPYNVMNPGKAAPKFTSI